MLDFGCGGGVGSRCLAGLLNAGGSLTCVDVSNYWIEKARSRLKKYPSVECRAAQWTSSITRIVAILLTNTAVLPECRGH